MSRRILVADDSQDTLQMLEVFLGLSGWEVFCAATLKEARARLDDGIDLVILDRWLADEDGLDLCRELRSRLPELPVVFLSGAAYPDDLKRAADAGCDAYLVKPCDMDELDKVVNQLLISRSLKAAPA